MTITLRDVTLRQGTFLLDRASLDVAAGAYGVVLGAAGSGKTTLLETVAGIRAPDGGTVHLGGADVTTVAPERRGVAMVYQQSLLFPHLDVSRNVAYGAKSSAAVDDAVAWTGIERLLSRFVTTLSAGEQQLVALARALSSEPRVLLLDEPFAALDEITRFRLDIQLRELWRTRRITVIFVTHSISEAAFLANRAVVLTKRGGGIKLDRRLDLPAERNDELRMDPRLGREMQALLGAMEEES